MAKHLNVGDVSGCLEIIGACDEAENDLQETFYQWAENEWDYYLYHREDYIDFKADYALNTMEVKSYENKEAMPKSFLAKYRKVGGIYKISHDKRFLWHKSQPNTRDSLNEAYRKKKLFKVRCNVCGRILYMDSVSFMCVKWKYCIGSECIATTIDNSAVDYTKSLYEWDINKSGLQVVDRQIALAEELSNPLTYYSEGSYRNSLKIAYISDIHLIHHLKHYGNDVKKMTRDMVEKLYQSGKTANIILFCGDIASSTEMTMYFFTQFKRKYDYRSFKVFKDRLSQQKENKKELLADVNFKLEESLNRINQYIETKIESIIPFFDFSAFVKYKERYCPNIVSEAAYEYFKKTKSFKKYEVSDKIENEILEIIRLLKIKNKYIRKIEQEEQYREQYKYEIEEWEERYSKQVEKITLNEYEHISLKDVYFVLGNHEYIEFPDIQTCVYFYKENLRKLGITVLHNEYLESDKYLLYGGTGFAKYEQEWNANTVVCCPNFTREDEIKETILFEAGYKEALEYAKAKGLCFICATHYPVSACLNSVFDKEAIYFTGHNHRNKYVKTSDTVLYADNQVGYKNNNVAFKIATTGFDINPYNALNDGLYQTTVDDYLKFYRYLGESIGEGKLLYQRCQKGNLYVVKRKGYYGFFIVSTKKDSKGISIVNGGVTKKLTTSTEISWICENFDMVVSKYLQMLLPLRNAQEELSRELKELGMAGTIHGLIVDIDFYHHIAVNPVKGSMEFYYASMFGYKKTLKSFDEVIQSLECLKSKYDKTDYILIRKKYEEKSKSNKYLLGMVSDSCLLATEEHDEGDITQRMEQIVSRTGGMYGVSRKISPLQRLFTGRVLRDFDLRLTETKQQQSHRKKLYIGRVFNYEGIRYQIVEDDGDDIVVAEELQEGSYSMDKGMVLTGNKRKFAIEALKAKIKSQNDYGTYWVD